MKQLSLVLLLVLCAATPLVADDAPAARPLDAKLDKFVRETITRCTQMTITQSDSPIKLPPAFTASLIEVKSPRAICEGQFLTVTTRNGGYYIGTPWPLSNIEGTTIEEKLRKFTWENMQQTYTALVDRHATAEGLFRVTLTEQTERGKVPLEGEVDPEGTVFFLGHFRRPSEDVRTSRLKAFEPFVARAPQEGAAKPDVTVIEFSDFECPSCRHASGYLAPILAKFPDRVRYVRYDLPLISNHPWAFSAAAAGRAIYRQKPAAFWDYKKLVYENQERLSAFMIDDFARDFAKDHDLDLARYDADVASPEVRDELLKATGAAFSNDVRSTPTYLVNGTMIDPGVDGKGLEDYVAELLKK
jgi:hypothetical protein